MAFWATFIDSPHELYTRTPDGRDLVYLTGTAGCDFRGTGSNWRRDQVYILAGPSWRRIDNVAPVASLAAVANDGTAVNEGYAADNVNWAVYNNRVLLVVSLAVRDSDGFTIRVSYQATALGQI